MKYITVTLNPVIDRMYTLQAPFKVSGLNRTDAMSEVVYSGKGINVSRELFRLGVDSKVMCILQGDDGETAYRSMVREDLNLFAIRCRGRMRNNISIMDPMGVAVEVNEPGCEVPFDEVVNFLAMYDKAVSTPDEKTVIISGSTPPGFRKDIYKMLIMNAKKHGCKTILDADGDLLKSGMEARPSLIKPNEFELSALVGQSFSKNEDMARNEALAAAALIYEKTGVEVLCTLGEKGSVFVGEAGSYICPAKQAQIKKFKGAGDMYLARFIYEHYELRKSVLESMRIASEKTARNLEK